MMRVFKNENNEGDAPYQKWLKDHPKGFVLQTTTKPNPEYMNLHSAEWKRIKKPTNSSKAAPFTAEGFIKICSEDRSDLVSYAKDYGRIDDFKVMSCCKMLMGRDGTNANLLPEQALLVLSKRAKVVGQASPDKVLVSSRQYVRSVDIVEYAKTVADGACSLCKCESGLDPLKFLDCHHIQWLRCGGADTRENVVGVCPNCHRRLHIAKDPADIDRLTKVALDRAENLDRLEL